MSWLEYLGLEYLLSDGKGFGEGISLGGLMFLLGGGCWFLLLITHPALVDKGAVVFNLLIAIILFILTIIRYVKNIKKQGESKKIIRSIFYILSGIIIIISFVYGLKNGYHSLLFDYQYKGIYSAIASILYPLIILNLLFPFFCEKNTLGNKIQEGIETIGICIVLTLVCFFVGQIVTLGLSFGGQEHFYDQFIIYQKR